MKVTVTFRHMESSEPLRLYAIEKVDKIKKYLSEPIEVHFVLSVEKFRHIADVTINANGIAIKAEEATEDMYSAIDLVISKIDRQVKKYKEKIKSHKSDISGSSLLGLKVQVLSIGSEDSEPEVIKTENYFIKPMSIDEAVMQMDLLNNDFLVFTNSLTDNINVIYKRKDGNYGLIEPIK